LLGLVLRRLPAGAPATAGTEAIDAIVARLQRRLPAATTLEQAVLDAWTLSEAAATAG